MLLKLNLFFIWSVTHVTAITKICILNQTSSIEILTPLMNEKNLGEFWGSLLAYRNQSLYRWPAHVSFFSCAHHNGNKIHSMK